MRAFRPLTRMPSPAGCSSAPSAGWPPARRARTLGRHRPPAAAAGPGRSERLEVTVNGSTVTPHPPRSSCPSVSTLELVVTSDHDDELHAHGFDQEQLKAGVPTTLRLTGTDPGVYEVETHEPALTLLTVAVR